MSTIEKTFAPAVEGLRKELALIEEQVVTGYTLADAIREGSKHSTQKNNWGGGESACALSAAAIAATARGYVA